MIKKYIIYFYIIYHKYKEFYLHKRKLQRKMQKIKNASKHNHIAISFKQIQQPVIFFSKFRPIGTQILFR